MPEIPVFDKSLYSLVAQCLGYCASNMCPVHVALRINYTNETNSHKVLRLVRFPIADGMVEFTEFVLKSLETWLALLY